MYVIISRDQCSFCDTAKELMKGYGISYVEYNIQSPSSKWLLYLLKRSSITTVPQIFNEKGTHIGGYAELKEYLEHETSS
jgi:glutaredoxin